MQDRAFQLAQVGLGGSAGLAAARPWADSFPLADLVLAGGGAAPPAPEDPRISLLAGGLDRPAFRDRMARRLRPLVVVDHGSAGGEVQLATFRALFPVLRAGGCYVVRRAADAGSTTSAAYDELDRIACDLVAGPPAVPPADDFARYFLETIESVTFRRDSVLVRKRAFRQRVFRTESLRKVAPGAVTADVGPAYPRIPAEIVDAGPEVAATFRGLQEQGPVQLPPACTAVVEDVLVVASGIALTGGVVLDETLNAARNIRRNGPLFRPTDGSVWVTAQPLRNVTDVPRTPGRHLVLLKQTWDSNYGHWLVDNLPKLALVRALHDLADCDVVVNEPRSEAMRRVMLDSLELAGVSEEQVRFVSAVPHRFEQLTIPGTISRHPVTKAPVAIRFLEEIASAVPPSDAERIYVSRNLGTRRRLVNEDEALAVLVEHGYRRIDPETLTLREQVALFRGATHVVGNMGAALSNLAFSPGDVRVLALATQTMQHDFFYDLVCHKPEGRYRGLQGRAVDASPSIGSDFTVDVHRLRECLEWLHA